MFSRIKKIIRSFNRTRYLYFLSQGLSKPFDIYNPIESIRIREIYLDRLIEFAVSDILVIHLLFQNKADESTLRKIYVDLTRVVSITYNHGFYIPASSLIDLVALHFILSHFDGEKYSIKSMDSYNSLLFIGKKLMTYFNTGDFNILFEHE